MPTNIFTKFVKDLIKNSLTYRAETLSLDNFGQFKGHNSGVPRKIWLVLELGRDIIPTNICTKFDKDRMKTLRFRKRNPEDAARPSASLYLIYEKLNSI